MYPIRIKPSKAHWKWGSLASAPNTNTGAVFLMWITGASCDGSSANYRWISAARNFMNCEFLVFNDNLHFSFFLLHVVEKPRTSLGTDVVRLGCEDVGVSSNLRFLSQVPLTILDTCIALTARSWINLVMNFKRLARIDLSKSSKNQEECFQSKWT